MEINGIAHVMLSVGRFDECREFYQKLLVFLGLKPVIDTESYLYCVGGRTAFGIRPCAEEFQDDRFDQTRVGLHHVCFRVRSREDVDSAFAFVQSIGAGIVHPPEEGPWAPGYYSVLFEDPVGTRLELNFVPGKGLLAESQAGAA